MTKGASLPTARPRHRFHGHRLYPRYAPLTRIASNVPGLAEALLVRGGGLLQDQTKSLSEDPTTEDIRSTSLVVCGLQRSGTTFLALAAESHLGRSGGVWQSHDPFAPRDFVPRNIPVIITLRSPLECAISKATYHGDPLTPTALSRRLDLVTTWLRLFAREPRSHLITLAEFDTFTIDPGRILSAVMGQSVSVNVRDVITRVELDDADRGVGSLQTHSPDEQRQNHESRFAIFADDASVRRHLARAERAMEVVRQNHGA